MSLTAGGCKKGEILRKAYYRKPYTRSDGTKVKGKKIVATCVPDKGLPGKTPASKKVLPKLKEGLLEKYGYSLSKSFEKRKIALRKAMKNEGDLHVLRRIVVLRTYNKNEPKLFKKLDDNVEFIQKERKKKTTTKKKKKTTKKKTTKKVVRFQK